MGIEDDTIRSMDTTPETFEYTPMSDEFRTSLEEALASGPVPSDIIDMIERDVRDRVKDDLRQLRQSGVIVGESPSRYRAISDAVAVVGKSYRYAFEGEGTRDE